MRAWPSDAAHVGRRAPATQERPLLPEDGGPQPGSLPHRRAGRYIRVVRQVRRRGTRREPDERQEQVSEASSLGLEREAVENGLACSGTHDACARRVERKPHLLEPLRLAGGQKTVLPVRDGVPEGFRRRRDRGHPEYPRLEELEGALSVGELVHDRRRSQGETTGRDRAGIGAPVQVRMVRDPLGEGEQGGREVDVAAHEHPDVGCLREQLRQRPRDHREVAVVRVGAAHVGDGRRPAWRVTEGRKEPRQTHEGRAHEVRMHERFLAEHGRA